MILCIAMGRRGAGVYMRYMGCGDVYRLLRKAEYRLGGVYAGGAGV